jgi:hypothetical protein
MYLFGCIPLLFHSIETLFVQPLFSNDKKRPASSSYGMLTGSVIFYLVQNPISRTFLLLLQFRTTWLLFTRNLVTFSIRLSLLVTILSCTWLLLYVLYIQYALLVRAKIRAKLCNKTHSLHLQTHP